MSSSLKRAPSAEPEESPEPKRVSNEAETPADDKVQTTPKKAVTEEVSTADDKVLQPPTNIGGVTITDKVKLTTESNLSNGKSNPILSSGFSLFSNGTDTKETTEESGTSIFAAALTSLNKSNYSSSSSLFNPSNGKETGGIFGSVLNTSSSQSSSGFVFGSNLNDRVVTPATPEKKEESPPETTQKKPEFKETTVMTGEEEETRLYQTTIKLYQFSQVDNSWVDRGAGVLRVNEKIDEEGRSSARLIVRSKAVMKVMLNTKIYSDAFINRANLTTIRLSGLHEGKLSTYLVKCTRNECDKLHDLLLKRRVLEQMNEKEFGSAVKKTEGDAGMVSDESQAVQTTEEKTEEATSKCELSNGSTEDSETLTSASSSTLVPDKNTNPAKESEQTSQSTSADLSESKEGVVEEGVEKPSEVVEDAPEVAGNTTE